MKNLIEDYWFVFNEEIRNLRDDMKELWDEFISMFN
jgi:hypothetical protein